MWYRHILGYCHYAQEINISLDHSKGALGPSGVQYLVHFQFAYFLFKNCELTFSLILQRRVFSKEEYTRNVYLIGCM